MDADPVGDFAYPLDALLAGAVGGRSLQLTVELAHHRVEQDRARQSSSPARAISASDAISKPDAKAISTYMGHSSIQITYDRYGHLMPGNEEEAADRLDAYLARSMA